jgi:hypothetical protein
MTAPHKSGSPTLAKPKLIPSAQTAGLEGRRPAPYQPGPKAQVQAKTNVESCKPDPSTTHAIPFPLQTALTPDRIAEVA